MAAKRLLILSRYSRLGASSRLRTLQYIPYLQAAGLQVDVASFFDDAYLKALYSGRRSWAGSAKYFLGRISQLISASKADVLWIEKEALPWIPWAIESLLWPRDVPVVTDYDDAVFHYYDSHRNPAVRDLLGDKIDNVMNRSAVVLAGNEYLASRARAAGAKRVEIVPTVVNTDVYRCQPATSSDGRTRIGWVGTPVTWAKYGEPLVPLLQDVMSQSHSVFRAIGAAQPEVPLANFEFLEWSEAREIQLIQGIDIGIMPLEDTPFARGKCGYKLIQYMACGLPVVASPVGVNSRIVIKNENGFLASTEREWRDSINALLSDHNLRKRMGDAGRRRVEAHYSIDVYGPRVANIIAEL
ncbi:glycosyltransferase family 4 protein [Pelagibacterium flavum]|uniref:Glycosyltransferase family 4 protein n=1 Tax=Pelagibacterium flavum TaxID=2984530 RepID=A0ABY6IPS0_9HYPH|nr:glycosyltransferase family 4 protein [Pelagibacterium sp. YIM 151497]UYQ72595.1 glycosyltransferase family 4 protein [Pelagibacterium sp. YIM 151497]